MENVCMTTIMLHPSMHLTAFLFALTWCTWLGFSTLLMTPHGNKGKRAGSGRVRKSGFINQQLACTSTCCELQAKYAGLCAVYFLQDSPDMCGGCSDIVRPPIFWMLMILHRNNLLVVNNNYLSGTIPLLNIQ
jgi:hypothetical protein